VLFGDERLIDDQAAYVPIVIAAQISDYTIYKARSEARKIMREAYAEADTVVREAYTKSATIRDKAEKQIDRCIAEMQAMVIRNL
jgi:vacuolar-type H+-ATPase subunit H